MLHCTQIHHTLNNTITRLIGKHANHSTALLDVGCWTGDHTLQYQQAASASKLIGIEYSEQAAHKAKTKNIHVLRHNLETDEWNLPNEAVDLIVCNQVLEHLKNIFLPLDQMSRVLKPGGILILSVPNLASFHNRIMLGCGIQPSSIRIWGPHIRGFTMSAFTRLVMQADCYECITIKGVGFFPLPPLKGGNVLGNIWKSACHTPVWVLRKTSSCSTDFNQKYCEDFAHTTLD